METREELMGRVQEMLNINSSKVTYVRKASDGQYYRCADLVSVTYNMSFDNEFSMRKWQDETGIQIGYEVSDRRCVVTLKHFYEPMLGARPKKGKVMTWDVLCTPSEDSQKREAVLNAICQKYLQNPPYGFCIDRKPFSKITF